MNPAGPTACAPALPPDEAERLRALRALGVLDSAAEERFDRLTRLARALFDVPIALISLVDAERQWFKSRANYYLLRLLFLSGIRDFQFVQFYPREYFCRGIELEAYSSFVPPECVLKAQTLGLNIRQIQLRYVSHPARASKTTLRTIIMSVFNIFTFWWRWRFGGGRKRTLAHFQKEFGGGRPWRKSSL